LSRRHRDQRSQRHQSGDDRGDGASSRAYDPEETADASCATFGQEEDAERKCGYEHKQRVERRQERHAEE
jgi:hypothetical protein